MLTWTKTADQIPQPAEITETHEAVVSYGLTDAKGRAVGALACIARRADEVTRLYVSVDRFQSAEQVEAHRARLAAEYGAARFTGTAIVCPVPEAERFYFQLQATRDGKTYGSSFPPKTNHRTLEAAKAHAEKAVARAAKRYAEKFAEVP